VPSISKSSQRVGKLLRALLCPCSQALKTPLLWRFWPWFLGVSLLFWALDRSDNDFFNKQERFRHTT